MSDPFAIAAAEIARRRAQGTLQNNSALDAGAEVAPGSMLEALRLESLTGAPAEFMNPAQIEVTQRKRDIARGVIATSPSLQRYLTTPAKGNAYLFVAPELQRLREAIQTPPPLRKEATFKRTQSEAGLRAGDLVVGYLSGALSPEQQAAYEEAQGEAGPDPDLARALGLDRTLLEEVGGLASDLQVPGAGQALFPGTERGIPRRTVSAVAGQLPNLERSLPEIATGGGLGYAFGGGAMAAVSYLFPPAAALVPEAAALGAKLGGTYGAFRSSFLPELAASVNEFERSATPDTPRNQVVGAAVLAASVKAGLDAASLSVLLSGVPGLKKLVATPETLTGPVLFAALGKDKLAATVVERFGAAWLANVGSETATEPIQEYVDIAGAAVLADKPLMAALAEGTPRAIAASEQALLATGVIGAAAPSITAFRDRARGIDTQQRLIERSERAEKHLQEIVTRAEELGKLREAAPEEHRTLVQGIAAEEGTSDVFIQPGKLLELWGKAQQTPSSLPQGVREQMADALATGRDLVIPMGTWLTDLQPVVKEGANGFVRLGPDLLDPEMRKQLTEDVEGEVKRTFEDAEIPGGAVPLLGDESLFGTPEDAGMTRGEYESYTRLRDEVTELKRGVLDARKVQELARRRGLVSRVLRARDRADAEMQGEIRKAVELGLGETPVWRAWSYLALGEWRGETSIRGKRIKLDVAKTVQLMGGDAQFAALSRRLGGINYAEQVRAVPLGAKSWLTAEDGIHPDQIAEQLGFLSGYDLVRSLLDAGATSVAAREQIIERETAKGVRLSEGAPITETEDQLLRTTLEDDFKIDRLVMEERSLAKKTERKVMPRKVLEAAAQRITRHSTPEQMRPELYRAAADRSRSAARQAIKEKNFEVASAHVRREAINRMLAISAVEARHEKAAIRRDVMKRKRTKDIREKIGLAGEDWLAQWDGLFERVELRRRTQTQRESLASFIREKETEESAYLLVPDWLLDQPRAFQDLTLDQARGFRAAVASVQNAALSALEVKVGSQRAALDATAVAFAQEILSTNERATPSLQAGAPTKAEKLRSLLRAADAVSTRRESLLVVLAQELGIAGVGEQGVIRPLQEAQSHADDLTREMAEPLLAHLLDLPKEDRVALGAVVEEARFFAPGEIDPVTKQPGPQQPFVWTRFALMSALANFGNDSNRTKLLEGYQWDEAMLRDAIEKHLTDADVRYVQQIWDVVESKKEEVFASYQRRYGVRPEEVQATPLTVRGIALRGGYFPVMFDPRYSRRGQRASMRGIDTERAMVGSFSAIETSHNFLISRTEVASPLLLQMDRILLRHLDEMILDLAFGETAKSVSDLLRHPAVDGAMRQVLGPEFGYAEFWRPWLAKIVSDTPNHRSISGLEILEKSTPRWIRFHAGVHAMAGNIPTLVVQPTSLANAANTLAQHSKLGRTEITRRLYEAVTTSVGRFSEPEARRVRESVQKLSGFMRNRIPSATPDYRDMVRSLQLRGSWSADQAERAMRWIAEVQYHTADLPTWIAAHGIALEEKGLDGQDAVFFADAAVRLAHGAGSKIDVPSFLSTDNEVMRLFTMYTNYPNMVMQQIRQTYRLNAATKSEIASAWMFNFTLPFVWSAAITGLFGLATGRSEPEDLKKPHLLFFRMLRDITSLNPITGIAMRLLQGGGGSSGLDSAGNLAQDLAHPTSVKDMMFDAIRSVMFWKLIPGAPIVRDLERALPEDK